MNNSTTKKPFPIGKLAPFLFLALLAVLPLFGVINYYVVLLVNCMAYAIFGIAWNIIGGYGAQISWCSSTFVAIGAYTNYIAFTNFGISPFVTLPLGMILSFIMATFIGSSTFRLRGAYFSIATIAFAEAFRSFIQHFADWTKGTAGIYVTFKRESLLDLTFRNDTPFYFIMLVLLGAAVLFTGWFTRSKTGYYLSAIKGDEDAAESLGIETFKIKLRAFQVSAVMMSVAGCFYGSFLTYISPDSTVSFDLSIKIGVVAILGGIGTLWGPVIGAFIIIPLIETASVLLGAKGSSNVLYGLLLILIVIFRPKGVISILDTLRERAAHKRAKSASVGLDH